MRCVVALLICLSFGCAPALVQSGRTYAIAWPGTEIDIVQIYDVDKGWAQCRSVNDRAIWWCNLQTTSYLAEVQPREPTPNSQSPNNIRAEK